MAAPTPEVYGIDHNFKALKKHLDALLKHQHEETIAALGCIERQLETMGQQLADMDTKLENIANQETQLGIDIQVVVDFLKAIPNPPQDLTAQLTKLDAISQKLIDTSASTLGNLPPTPAPPVPARRK